MPDAQSESACISPHVHCTSAAAVLKGVCLMLKAPQAAVVVLPEAEHQRQVLHHLAVKEVWGGPALGSRPKTATTDSACECVHA